MSNNTVTVETTTSTVNLGATQAAPKAPKNATKQQAAALADIAIGFRKAKSSPSKVMTSQSLVDRVCWLTPPL